MALDRGHRQRGTVWFRPLGADRTEVKLALTFEPEGVVEKAGDVLGFVKRRARGDLENFKEMIVASRVARGEARFDLGASHGEYANVVLTRDAGETCCEREITHGRRVQRDRGAHGTD